MQADFRESHDATEWKSQAVYILCSLHNTALFWKRQVFDILLIIYF